MNRTVLLLATALLLSLALNALQWFGAPSPEAREHRETQPAQDGPQNENGDTADGTEPSADENGCWVALAECRADGLSETQEAASVFTEEGGGVPENVQRDLPTTPLPGGDVDEEFQEEVLCTIALEHLRRDWEERKDETIASLAESLADEEERRAMLDRDLARAQQLFEFEESERVAFETEYRELWSARVEEIAAAMASTPPDARASFDLAKTLFEDEDALVDARFGEEGRRKLRLAQAERRTAVLALLATHAEVPWDATISW